MWRSYLEAVVGLVVQDLALCLPLQVKQMCALRHNVASLQLPQLKFRHTDFPLCRKIVWRCWPPLADDGAVLVISTLTHDNPGNCSKFQSKFHTRIKNADKELRITEQEELPSLREVPN